MLIGKLRFGKFYVNITTPEYDPDIDGDSQPTTDKKHTTISMLSPNLKPTQF